MSEDTKNMEQVEEEGPVEVATLPVIKVTASDRLSWNYHRAPHFAVTAQLSLVSDEDQRPRLYVHNLSDENLRHDWTYIDPDASLLADEEDQALVEEKWGAMTRIWLLEAHVEEIRNPATREAGLARVREAATAAGLYGIPEPYATLYDEYDD